MWKILYYDLLQLIFFTNIEAYKGLTLLDKMLFFLPRSLLGFFEYLGADFHFENIARGILDSRDILYFLSVSFVGLYGTQRVLEEKS